LTAVALSQTMVLFLHSRAGIKGGPDSPLQILGPPTSNQCRNEKTCILWWGKNILRREGGKQAFGGQTYTKYNKINNNLENFRGARLLPGVLSPPGPP